MKSGQKMKIRGADKKVAEKKLTSVNFPLHLQHLEGLLECSKEQKLTTIKNFEFHF